MRHIVIAALLALPCGAFAQDTGWQALTGDDMRAALTGKVLDYGDKWQDFRASGRTLYFSGAESWGYWEVRGDKYCSQWPPSDLWACYVMMRRGDVLRFVGAAGDTTDGVVRPKQE